MELFGSMHDGRRGHYMFAKSIVAFATSIARNAARASPAQIVIASSTSALIEAAGSASGSDEHSGAFTSGLPKLQKVRHRPAEWASITAPMPLFYPQRFTGVLMKSRLLSSTPQWRQLDADEPARSPVFCRDFLHDLDLEITLGNSFFSRALRACRRINRSVRTFWIASSKPPPPTANGSLTSPMSGQRKAGSMGPPLSTSSPGVWWAGR